MTIYGEFDAQFRKKPALWRLFLIGLSALVVSSVFVSFLLGAAIGLAGRANQETESTIVLFAPPVVTGSILLDAAMGTFSGFAWVAGAAALAIAILIIFFWPSEPSLASQLVGNALGTALVVFGALTLPLESILAQVEYLDDPRKVAEEAGVLLAALIFAVLAERKTIALLSNLVAMDAPSRRVRIWLMRVGIPLALLGAAAWILGSMTPAIAAAAFLVVTFFENLARRPNAQFVQLRDVQMKEAAATLPLVAVLLVAASVWAFGFAPLRPSRALVWRGGRQVSFETLDVAWAKSGLARPIPRQSVIRIEWSK
ncbi:MAG TPA: hypothetical protein VGF40_08415 [Thermoanaerobaculia bacterium]